MSNQDDFNILPEEPNQPAWTSRRWIWVLLIVAIAIFAFAVGMALRTFSQRVGNGVADLLPTVTAAAVVPTFTDLPPAVATATTTAVSQPTPTNNTPTAPLPSPTLAPTTAPTQPPPVVTCQRAVYPPLAVAYDSQRLGCAVTDAALVWSAWEAFERGAMFWRNDTNRTFAFFNDGRWTPVDERWDGQPAPSRGDPPAGLRAPERGFGYAWAIRDDLFQRLGWAADQERGFCAVIQTFDRGFILQSSDVEFCQDNLYNHARAPEWKPLLMVVSVDGTWRNLAGAPGTAPTSVTTPIALTPGATTALPTNDATATALAIATPLPTPTLTSITPVVRRRPERNGTFTASPRPPASLDGSFHDWSGNWSPLSIVVQGSNNYSGPDDVAGDFQAAWSRDGLYLAVRVRDDRYRAGPDGTDMWQGDALELHLDRFLTLDYDGAIADADDYQLGVSFGPERNTVRLYRWLPLEKEGNVSAAGIVLPVNEGYDLELLLPWSLFDIGGDELFAGQLFGFNLSISDNDADTPAQETVLSASPSRTTYNNPTEWGTLVLGN